MPTTAPAPEQRAPSRERFAEAWGRLPGLLAAVGRAPQEVVARFQLAAGFGSLGLGTAAEAHLARLPREAQSDHGLRQLRFALRQLPADEIAPERRFEICRVNLAVLERRGMDLSGDLRRWQQRNADERWFAALDGNIIRCRGSLDAPAGWRRPGDDLGDAERFADEQYPAGRLDYTPPIIVEGLDPPWLVRAIHARTAEPFNGYTPRIRIVQRDVLEFLDGLSAVDLAEMLTDERVEVYVGDDAGRRLRDALTAQADVSITGPCVTNPGLGQRIDPPPSAIVGEVNRLQQQHQAALAAEVDRLYAQRDRGWWVQRYGGAPAAGGTEPLRVLVLNCRFSTYVQHANDDLAEAFSDAGCEVRVIIEPDDHSRLMATPYLRAVREFRPDLVVLVNYLRSAVEGMIPRNVPLVSWIQDSMPHLFDGDSWRRGTDLDYIAGHTARVYFSEFGFPVGRALAFPMVASGRKFHDGSITAGQRRRFGCEIAFATRHSETPRQMHERLKRDLAQPAAFNDVLDQLYRRIEAVIGEWSDEAYTQRIDDAIIALFGDAFGRSPEQGLLKVLGVTYATPLADRMLRHQALYWAADLAEQHGWRLHVYGRGWESHRRFGRYARGELAHGEDLRAAYQAAAVHLHACAATLLHQRIIECALSGGLPLCRLKPDDLRRIRCRLKRRLTGSCRPDGFTDGGDAVYDVVNHLPAMRCVAQHNRLGLPFDDVGRVHVPRAFREGAAVREQPRTPSSDEEWPFVDLAESTFRDRQGLEELVRRALERPAWRQAMSAAMAGRLRSLYTTSVFAARMLDHVHRDLRTAP